MTLDSAGLDALIADVEGASNESFRRDWLLLRLRYARSLAAAAPPTGENPDGPMTEALWKYAQNEWGWGADDYEACRDAITAVVAAGRAAVSPDPPTCAHGLTGGSGATERCLECGASVTAASPDERLREAAQDALGLLDAMVRAGDGSGDSQPDDVWRMAYEFAIESAGEIAPNLRAALAADREAPDKPQEHTQECADAMFMHHAATGGDMECTCRAAADREAPDPSVSPDQEETRDD